MAISTTDDGDFLGAKCALFLGEHLLVLRRDDTPGLLWAGALDLPGGGRDVGELRPEETVLREIFEEVGLRLAKADLSYARRYTKPEGHVWYFAAHLPAACEADIVLGGEGQGWMVIEPSAFISAEDGVPVLQERLEHYLAWRRAKGV
ncbi:MAG: NUDIX domain-containing protein [Marinovum sp.]|nr:NUDIX domain-containing protein [Marinovum sp.]